LSGWSITGGIQFSFPEGTRIRGRGYLVVASDLASFTAAGLPNVVGPFLGGLNNGGEQIELRDRSQCIMDTIDYGVDSPWVSSADGTGLSLAKINPDTGSDAPENWAASGQIGGTPGLRN